MKLQRLIDVPEVLRYVRSEIRETSDDHRPNQIRLADIIDNLRKPILYSPSIGLYTLFMSKQIWDSFQFFLQVTYYNY